MHGRISAMSRRSFRRIGNSKREWGWIMDDTANTSETTTISVRDFLPNKLNLSPFGAWQTNRLLWGGSRAGGIPGSISLNIKCIARCGEKIIRSQALLLYSHTSFSVYRTVCRCQATAHPIPCIITPSTLRPSGLPPGSELPLPYPPTHLNVMPNEYIEVKVKQSHYRPGQALRIPGSWGSQISRQSAHEGDKVVSLKHRPLLPPGIIPGTHFC
jgi:hypothetical protein